MFSRLTLALTCCASFCTGIAAAEPRLVFSGSVSIGDAGGLSGLELGPDGRSGITVSDRGEAFSIHLKRTNGELSSVSLTPWPSRSNIEGDVEGIATNDNQTYFFSLEGPASVIAVSEDGKTTTLPRHQDFAKMRSNRALEALAIDQNGVLYTLPEVPADADNGFSLYALENQNWSLAATLPSRGSFSAVGADFGPDNLFYLLERTITPLGFRTRVRRFDLSATDLAEQTLLTTLPSSHDNLEGISLWQDASGATRVTMISDDNFRMIQRNEIVEYILQE
jgi:hypothetical protein